MGGKPIIHGQSGTIEAPRSAEYTCWTNMRRRCLDPNSPPWPRYGGRGIKVCGRWDSFADFLADMGPRPSPRHTIERKDNDGDYEPNNCRWATRREQQENTSQTMLLTFGGRTQGIAVWARELGMKRRTLVARVTRLGWTVEQALTTPAAPPQYPH